MIKELMKLFPSFPSENNFDNWEIFNHENYLNSSEKKKNILEMLHALLDMILKKIKNILGWKIIF